MKLFRVVTSQPGSVSVIDEVSSDAANEIASAHRAMGFTVNVYPIDSDECEPVDAQKGGET